MVAIPVQIANVATSAKSSISCAREHNRPDIAVVVDLERNGIQLLVHIYSHGIELGRPVKHDVCDFTLSLEANLSDYGIAH